MKNSQSNVLVSVCIPAHNPPLEAFRKCVASVLCQTYKNIEVLISDDSGEENLKEVVAEFNDPRITYLSKAAEGVHANREFLLSKLKGEFMAFVDADDFVDPRYVEFAIRGMEQSDEPANTVVFLENPPNMPNNSDFLFAKESNKDFFLEMVGYHFYYVWGKLFPREMVYGMNVVFDDGADDVQIMQKCAQRINCIIHTYGAGYHYCYNPTSVTHSTTMTYLFSYLSWMYAKKLIYDKYAMQLPEIEICILITKATLECIDYSDEFPYSKFRTTAKEIRKYHKISKLKLDNKYEKKAYLLKFAPSLFAAFYRKKLLRRASSTQ